MYGLLWSMGYRIIGIAQLVLAIILLLSLPLWKKVQKNKGNSEASIFAESSEKSHGVLKTIRMPGAKVMMFAFFCYCAVETTTGLWASSYMVLSRGLDEALAATYASLFYLGITVGRMLSGFVSDALGDRIMVRIGVIFRKIERIRIMKMVLFVTILITLALVHIRNYILIILFVQPMAWLSIIVLTLWLIPVLFTGLQLSMGIALETQNQSYIILSMNSSVMQLGGAMGASLSAVIIPLLGVVRRRRT